jgi:NADH-quinone oxidoreductase subunit L
VLLALGAIFAGGYAFDHFGGIERNTFWNNAIFILPEHDSINSAGRVAGIYKTLPLVSAYFGIVLSYIFYVALPEMPAIVSTAFGSLYRFVYSKFYIDELYDALFVRSARWCGGFLWKKGDDALIDGFGPDGLAVLSMRIAKRVGAMESGYLYHYAFAMILGVAGFVSWFWFKG